MAEVPVRILKGTNAARPKASASTLNAWYLTTDSPGDVYIGIMDSKIGYAWYSVGSGLIYASDVIYDGSTWPTPVTNVEEALNYLYSQIGNGTFGSGGELYGGFRMITDGLLTGGQRI